MPDKLSILILFGGKYPGPSAGAKRVEYYMKGLTNERIEVEILPVCFQASGRISFYLFQFLLPFKAVIALIKYKKRHDILFIYGFGWLTYFFLSFLARLKKTKIYLEINEKPGTVYGNRFTELRLIRLFTLLLTRFSHYFFDGFVVISSNLEDYLRKYVKSEARILKVPILIGSDRNLQDIKEPNAFKPYLLHSGALSERKDGISEVFEAFAIVCKRLNYELHFYLTSKAAPKNLRQKIEKVVKENDLKDNVHFLGNIPENLLISFQKFCSLVVINKIENEQNLFNFPTKLGEYLSLGKPVITTGIGEMGKYLSDKQNAFIVPSHDVNALAEKIMYVIQHPQESFEVSRQGIETANAHFNFITQGKRLAEFFNHA